MTPQEVIDKLKSKSIQYAKEHATENAKAFYIAGKRDAAAIILAMIQADGVEAAITDVAKELLRHDPEHQQAKWVINEWQDTRVDRNTSQ